MGKTILFSEKMFKKMISIHEKSANNTQEKKFIRILKQTITKHLIIRLDFLQNALTMEEADQTCNPEMSLAARIIQSYLKSFSEVDLSLSDLFKLQPFSVRDVLSFIVDHAKPQDIPLIIIHLDETQELITWKSRDDNDTRRKSYIYYISEILSKCLMSSKDIVLSYVYTGLNTIRMSDLQVISNISHQPRFSLQLLTTDHMMIILRSLIMKLYGKGFSEKITFDSTFQSFLNILLGNPRLFANFLSACSQYGKDQLESSSMQANVKSPLKSIHVKVIDNIIFSQPGFKYFLSQEWQNDKRIMWACMKRLYVDLMKTTLKSVFDTLDVISPYCFLSLLYYALLGDLRPIKKIDKVPLLKNDTFGSLEEKGILYLNPSSSVDEFQVKICLPILHHMANILKVKAKFGLPIFDLDPNLTWEDNESSDVHLILLKIWDLCQANPHEKYIDISSILPLQHPQEEILVKTPKFWKVCEPENRIVSFKDLVAFKRNHDYVGFINSTGAPWGDGGLILELKDKKKRCD